MVDRLQGANMSLSYEITSWIGREREKGGGNETKGGLLFEQKQAKQNFNEELKPFPINN